ncbi:MAG: hypothetical protein ACRELA_13650 [Candidatus Rokuibacteriota bacterium]
MGLIEPLTATMIGVVLFGDELGALGAMGAGFLLAAVALLTVSNRHRT